MGQRSIEPGAFSLKVRELLANERENRGVSFRALADSSGINRLRIQRCFRGELPLYVDELEAISRALGLTPWKVIKQAEDSLSITPESYDAAHELARRIAADPDGYALAARQHEPDPYEELGEENQDVDFPESNK